MLMSRSRGHIRYTLIEIVLILLFASAAVAAVFFRGSFTAEYLQLERHRALYEEEKNATSSFYVCLHSSEGPVMTERSIPRPLISDDLHLAVEALLLDESSSEIAEGLISYIPEGTRLSGISEMDGDVFADFSSELEGAPEEAFEEIILTLRENTGNENVRIMISGQLI